MPRLFVAVEVPAHVRDAVSSAVAPLRSALPGLRWIAPDRYHLTVVFIGSVDEGLVGPVGAAVAAGCLGAGPFQLALDGRLGSFGRRVLWAGLEPSAALTEMAGAVASRVAQVVPLPDAEREFRAHLTLARAGRGRGEGRGVGPLGEVAVPPLSWDVERVVLLRSAGGYHLERAVPLAGVADT
jgi:2'-5' RNA ligase